MNTLALAAKEALTQIWETATPLPGHLIPARTPYVRRTPVQTEISTDGLSSPVTVRTPDEYRLLTLLDGPFTGTCPDCQTLTVFVRIGTNLGDQTPIYLCPLGQHRIKLETVEGLQTWSPSGDGTTPPTPLMPSVEDEIMAVRAAFLRLAPFYNQGFLTVLHAIAQIADPNTREAAISQKKIETITGIPASSVREMMIEVEGSTRMRLRMSRPSRGRAATRYRVPTVLELAHELSPRAGVSGGKVRDAVKATLREMGA